jgi:hypothetical protein
MDKENIGYKSPPVSTRFKPGQSGNPNGRPKHSKSLKGELLDELSELINIGEAGREQAVTKARAIAKSLVAAAIQGDLRAVTALLAFYAKIPGDRDEQHDLTVSAEDAEIVDDFIDRESRRRVQHDATGNDTLISNHQQDKES